MGFAYSFFFAPGDEPIDCFFKFYTGRASPTWGFPRSFGHFLRGRFEMGLQQNILSFSVFCFFVLQFLWRTTLVSFYFATHKQFSQVKINSDIIISILLFLLAFL